MTQAVNESIPAGTPPYQEWRIGGSVLPGNSAQTGVASGDGFALWSGGRSQTSLPAQPPWLGSGGIASVISGFGSAIDKLIAFIAGQLNGLGCASTQTPSGPEQAVNQATFTDWGDPHLSASGTTNAGQTISGAWDSMSAHGNLLSSDSFDGGFQISTAVSDPNAQGVTLNASASVLTQNGGVSVSMDGSGATTAENGQTIAMQAGQSYALGNDEVATENADGSVVVNQANANGGSIATTLTRNSAGGVDINASASGVDLGGYLLTHVDETGAIA